MVRNLWVFNIGSTGFKWQVLALPGESRKTRGKLKPWESVLASGRVRRSETSGTHFSWSVGDKLRQHHCKGVLLVREMLAELRLLLGASESFQAVDACVFKTVHLRDAEGLPEAVLLTDEILERMDAYHRVAPAHNPPYLEMIRAVQQELALPCIGAFETVFHQTIAPSDYLYAVPYSWYEAYGIRRYGFHGASHRYISERLHELLPGREPFRAVSVHLGGSSSMCALLNGRSVLTSMGFSPQGKLPNATRCGDLDPFAVLWLLECSGESLDSIANQLVANSGLEGLSGIPRGNIHVILKLVDRRAERALEHLVHQIVETVGAYAARLGGLDAIAFTGGIGEHEPKLRAEVCRRLLWMGVQLDRDANEASGEHVVSSPESQIAIFVIPTHEELIVARRALHCDLFL